MIDPLKQQTAQLLLQLFDLEGNGRLTVAQCISGSGKAVPLCYLLEGSEIRNFRLKISK